MKVQTAPLTKEEFIGLMRLAQREARTPNEQLRYLVRKAVIDEESPPVTRKEKTAINACVGNGGLVGINP